MATPDRRTLIANEIYSTEKDYLQTLNAIKTVFFMPLKNALASNRY